MARKATVSRRDPLSGFFPPQPVAAPERLAGTRSLALDQVLPDPEQPRKDWAYGEGARLLDELVASVREFGILQPLLVREDGVLEDQRPCYRIVAGARRREAASRAGLTQVPVVVRDEPQVRVRVLQLVENLHRQDLSPLDEANAYQELMRLQQVSATALAASLHVSGQRVRDRLRLLADQVLADAVARRQISATAAREIIQLPDEDLTEFRRRVQAGERLQSNDVARARARSAARGVTHERRKGASVPPPAAPMPEAVQSGLLADHTTCDLQALGQNGTDAAIPLTPVEPLSPVPAALHVVPSPASEAPGEPTPSARELLATIPKPVQEQIATVLRFGARVGWSCEELLAYLGMSRRKV